MQDPVAAVIGHKAIYSEDCQACYSYLMRIRHYNTSCIAAQMSEHERERERETVMLSALAIHQRDTQRDREREREREKERRDRRRTDHAFALERERERQSDRESRLLCTLRKAYYHYPTCFGERRRSVPQHT